MFSFKSVASILLLVLIAGCSTKVARVDTASTIDLTGRWNDTDSRLVAEEMINDALNQRWLYSWEAKNQRPTVIVGNISNRSHEHINTQTFTRNIERALLNSGRVDFVATRDDREQIREERLDQGEHASVYTQKQMGEEYGADLMMMGTINSITDQEGRRAVIYYQVNMELVEIESNRKVWIGEKQIKKYVERATTKF